MNIIKQARTTRGLTLRDAADLLGTDAGNLCRIEQGQQEPSIKLARRIGQVYGLSMDQIYQSSPTPREAA